jgi:hypothetical protein
MKESVFFKKYFDLAKDSTRALSGDCFVLQLSFFSNKEINLFRQLIFTFNERFNKQILSFYFFSQSALASFESKGSSFNYVLSSFSQLAIFAFLDTALRLNLNFFVISFLSKFDDIFSINFFKSFAGNKLLLKLNFIKTFAEKFLCFIKKIEFFNKIKILTILKKIR